jgi:hypothetical protein
MKHRLQHIQNLPGADHTEILRSWRGRKLILRGRACQHPLDVVGVLINNSYAGWKRCREAWYHQTRENETTGHRPDKEIRLLFPYVLPSNNLNPAAAPPITVIHHILSHYQGISAKYQHHQFGVKIS